MTTTDVKHGGDALTKLTRPQWNILEYAERCTDLDGDYHPYWAQWRPTYSLASMGLVRRIPGTNDYQITDAGRALLRARGKE